jgi:hypothetical protein
MPRFLIELPHEPEYFACKRYMEIFRTTGSHFLARAEWGCGDGQHSAWLIVEARTRAEARLVVPAAFRHQARVVRLSAFDAHSAEALRALHPGVRPAKEREDAEALAAASA